MHRPINESGFIDRPAYGFNTVQLLLLHDASSRLTVTAVFASSSAKTRLMCLTHFFELNAKHCKVTPNFYLSSIYQSYRIFVYNFFFMFNPTEQVIRQLLAGIVIGHS